MSLAKLQSVTGVFCTSPNSMNPGIWLQGQVVVHTAMPAAATITSAARPERIFLVAVILQLSFERAPEQDPIRIGEGDSSEVCAQTIRYFGVLMMRRAVIRNGSSMRVFAKSMLPVLWQGTPRIRRVAFG